MAHQQSPFSPFLWLQSLSCCLSRVARRSTPKPRGPLYSPSEPSGPFPHLLWSRVVSFLLQSCMVYSFLLQSRVVYSFPSEPHGLFFPSEPHGLFFFYFRAGWSTPSLQSRMVSSSLQSRMVSSYLWLPGLGLNPSSHLPLQPISDSSYSQLHLPASPYSSSFTGLP